MLTCESCLYLYDRMSHVVAEVMVTYAFHHNIEAQDYGWDSEIYYGGILRPTASMVASSLNEVTSSDTLIQMAEVAMSSNIQIVLVPSGNTWMIVQGVGSSHGCLDLQLLFQAQVNNFQERFNFCPRLTLNTKKQEMSFTILYINNLVFYSLILKQKTAKFFFGRYPLRKFFIFFFFNFVQFFSNIHHLL